MPFAPRCLFHGRRADDNANRDAYQTLRGRLNDGSVGGMAKRSAATPAPSCAGLGQAALYPSFHR